MMTKYAVLGLALLATGCGAGGVAHSTALTPAAATAAPTGTARFTLTIPNASTTSATNRRPAFVSPSTLSGTIQVNAVITQLDLSVGSPNCANVTGGRACTISAPAPIGSDTFAITLYDGAFTAGMHTGNALSAASNFMATVTEGTANVTTPLILGGIVAAVDVTVGALTGESPGTAPVTITTYDVHNNTIIGAAAYADATGAAAPITIATNGTPQFTLHDAPQSGSSVQVAGTSDVVTLQLNAPATILGSYLTVTSHGGSALPAVAVTNRFIAVTGTLQTTLLAAQVNYQPDDIALAPSDASLVTGVPNGFAFSITSASGGGFLGYFNSSTESIQKCTVTGFSLGVAPIENGIVSAFNGADNIQTSPSGVTFYPLAALNGSPCAGTPYTSNAAGFAQYLVFDQAHNLLYEGDNNHQLTYDDFVPPSALSSNTLLASYAAVPHDLLSLNGATYFLSGCSNQLNIEVSTNPATQATAGTDSLCSLSAAPDGRVYGLGTLGKQAWVYNGTALMTAYTPANGFTIAVSTLPYNLAIGPDGSAYTTDNASTIQGVSPAGVPSTVVIAPPGGNIGFLKGVFDGHNGFVYAYYDDGLHAGVEYVYRISY
jgi:hypothetical protein